MSNPPPSDPTIAYYDQNAAAFARDTLPVNLEEIYSEFLPLLPTGGRILDAGCGSARDAAHFKRCGFSVTAFDASSEMAAIAAQTIGEPVRVMTFADVAFLEEFDGIWACASLLHLPDGPLDDALNRLAQSLRPGGVLYVSFKYGREERRDGGRFFNDFDEDKLDRLLSRHPSLAKLKVWRTRDARPGRSEQWWLNVILTKL